MEAAQTKLETWAVVELLGHQREVGYLTTQYFGPAALFQIDVPTIPETTVTLSSPEYGPDRQWLAAGTTVTRAAREGKTRLIGPSSIYAINPCSEEAAMRVLMDTSPRIIKVIEVPKRAITAPADLVPAIPPDKPIAEHTAADEEDDELTEAPRAGDFDDEVNF